MYYTALSTFFIYIFEFDGYLIHKSWITSIKTLLHMVLKMRKIKYKNYTKTIQKLYKNYTDVIEKADENCHLIDLQNYSARNL